MHRNLLSEIQFVNIVVSSAIIAGVVIIFLIVISYSMIVDLRSKAIESADEIESFIQYPLYIVDNDQAVRIGNTFLSSGKISGIILESTSAGNLLARQVGKASPWIPRISRDIYHEGVLVGRFTITFGDDVVYRTMSRFAMLSLLIVFTVFLAIVTANRLLISKKVSGAFKPILSGIEDFSEGRYESLVKPAPYKDVNTIVNHINDMATKIHWKDRQQKKIEERLVAERQYLLDIIDFLPDATFIIDTEKKIVAWNIAAESMTGVSRHELIGKGDYEYALPFFGERRPILIDLIDIAEDAKAVKTYKFIKRSGEAIYAESFIPTLNEGRGAHLWGVAAPLFDRNGNRTGAIELIRDVTDYKQAEKEKQNLQAQLLQSQKMEAIGTLAGGIAHDFNNILSAIIGYTEIALYNEFSSDAPARNSLENVLKAGLRAKDLVQQILTFSRQSDKEFKPVEIGVIAEEATKLLRSSLPATIEIRTDFKSKPLVMGDPTQIHQVLMNLCTNAGHAMRENGGLLTMEIDCIELKEDLSGEKGKLNPGRYAQIVLSDTGQGIPAKHLERIFEPFFTTKKRGEGTGMGLSVVHGIVESCNGAIGVSSEEGKGTTFKVYLPAIERRSAPEAPGEEDVPRGAERILIIDDEPAILEMTKLQLETLGYRVTSRVDSLKALTFFKHKTDDFDLIITDMTMPKMSGDELAREIKAIRPDIPVIICTGFSAKWSFENSEQHHFDAFLMKPIIIGEMARVVRSLMEQAYSIDG